MALCTSINEITRKGHRFALSMNRRTSNAGPTEPKSNYDVVRGDEIRLHFSVREQPAATGRSDSMSPAAVAARDDVFVHHAIGFRRRYIDSALSAEVILHSYIRIASVECSYALRIYDANAVRGRFACVATCADG